MGREVYPERSRRKSLHRLLFFNKLIMFLGRYSSGQRGQTVNLLVFTFAGSNPALPTINFKHAGVAQLVERQPSKLNVAGSNPVSRSKELMYKAYTYCLNLNLKSRCSSGVERFLGKEEVTGSNPVIGSNF